MPAEYGAELVGTALTQAMNETRSENEVHLELGLLEMDLALPDYQDAEKYYEGKKAEVFSHPKIARLFARTAGKFKLNFARTPVDVVADRLKISSVTVKQKSAQNETNEEKNQTEDDDLTKLFEREVWKRTKMLRKSRNLHTKVSEYGDSYFFIWCETEEDDEGRTVMTNRPVVYYNSPKTTRVVYDPEAPDEALFVIKKWKDQFGQWRAKLYYSNIIEGFRLKPQVKIDSEEAKDAKSWVYEGQEENPFNRLPIFHFRNHDQYGIPEHVNGYGPQDAINKISTTMVHTTDFQGFPQRYGLADPNGSVGGSSMDSADWDDEDDAPEKDDGESGMETGPGTFLTLQGIKQAGTFEAAESKTFLDPAEFYIRAMAQTTTTPLRFFYPPGAHPPSGESYRAEDAPLINKVKDRQDFLEETYQDAYAFCMEIVTGTPAEEFIVDVKWAPAASIEDALGWETVKRKIDAGIPRRQALIEAGYTADQVDDWLKQNHDKVEFLRDVETFSLFAAAAKNLADTSQQNGLHEEAVGKVLTHILQRFVPDLPKLKEPEPKPEQPPQLNPNPNDPNDPNDPRVREGYEKAPRLDIPPGGIRPDRPTTVPSR